MGKNLLNKINKTKLKIVKMTSGNIMHALKKKRIEELEFPRSIFFKNKIWQS